MIAREIDMNWSGMLTTKNVEQVAELLRQLLKGKRYTFVSANEIFGFKPEVHPSLKLDPGIPDRDPVSVYHHEIEGKPFAGLHVCDTHAVWGFSTSLEEDRHDNEFRNPHFVFSPNKVTITHRVAAGHKVYWVVAVERD